MAARMGVEKLRFLLVTLGCFRNEVESDVLRTAMARLGAAEESSPEDADVIIVNTCGFIRPACDEGIDTLLEVAAKAASLPSRPPVVALGCMAQRYGYELFDSMPELGGVLGAAWRDDLARAIETVVAGERFIGGLADSRDRPPLDEERKVDSSENATLLVRVADGCDRACAFCTIPGIRGRNRSRSPGDVTAEIDMLCGDREREVVLVAQDLTSYGSDLGLDGGLVKLIGAITRIDRVRWLRLLYLQPEGVTDELIDAVVTNERVCDYFDIPFQHVSTRVLRSMGRPGSAAEYARLVEKIRAASSAAALRTTVMAGYPGEEEEDFSMLLSFLEEMRFDWLGAFVYSPEDGTRAAGAASSVRQEVAKARYDRILQLQDSVEASAVHRFMGRDLEVVIDGEDPFAGYEFVGRSYREAPVVDGAVYLNRVRDGGSPAPEVRTGEFVTARITGQEGLDLVGEIRGTG